MDSTNIVGRGGGAGGRKRKREEEERREEWGRRKVMTVPDNILDHIFFQGYLYVHGI